MHTCKCTLWNTKTILLNNIMLIKQVNTVNNHVNSLVI